MPTTTAIIKYVNPAKDGRKPSVKTEDGVTYQCKDHQIALFQQGRTYKIEYSGEREFNGKTYRNVESAAPVETAGLGSGASSSTGAASPSMASHQGHGYKTSTSPEDSERMFVCSLMNAFIQAGKIEPEQGRVITAVNVLRGAYRATFGSTYTFHASDVQQRTARG